MKLFRICEDYGSFIFFVVCVSSKTVLCDGVPCVKRGDMCGCVFTNQKGEHLQISLADLNKKGKPFFPRINGIYNSGWPVFSLNLCSGFTRKKPPGCSDVTHFIKIAQRSAITKYFANGCKLSVARRDAYAIGKPNSEKFGNYIINQPLVVTYSANDVDANRSTVLNLICHENITARAKFTEEIYARGVDYYHFNITSKYLCPRNYTEANAGESSSKGLSIGSIIVIVFFVLLFLYFVGGALIMKYNGATEKDVIPHVNFWSSLPGLIKDGCIFFGKSVTRLCKRGGYNQM